MLAQIGCAHARNTYAVSLSIRFAAIGCRVRVSDAASDWLLSLECRSTFARAAVALGT